MKENDRSESVSTRIYFTDFFATDPAALEAYGAFNISLINDLPLFIDPFLLFDSKNPNYVNLHDGIIRYVKFLRDISLEDQTSAAMRRHWFRFPEVKQNWLGFSRSGNDGSGLGRDFADALHRNLGHAFRNFGEEGITRGSHLEKLCLLGDGVGRDHLSDFTTNLIKGYLLEYTQAFSRQHLAPAFRASFAVEKVHFDYDTRRWQGARYDLPTFAGDYVILTPKDILTKDEAWINRADLLERFQDIYPAVPNAVLRAQVGEYFLRRLGDEDSRKAIRQAAASAVAQFPQILDHYIKAQEERALEAHNVSRAKVRETEVQFIEQIRALVDTHLTGTPFYELGDSFEEALARVLFLKNVIENQDGHRWFYVKGKPLKREADLQTMYRLTWYATSLDVNREVNNGRGPVDYKVSRGSADSTLVEFKLASNSKLEQNLKHQVGVYEAANNTASSIKVILFFSVDEHRRVNAILERLSLSHRVDVVLIDARSDNKPSASEVRD